MKEMRIKMDVYIPLSDEDVKRININALKYSIISTILEREGFGYQIYEQEIQDV